MAFEPFSDFVLIRRSESASSEIDDGLSTPEAAREKPHEGVVIAVGPGYLSETGYRSSIQAGINDHVLFGRYAGTEIVVNGEKLLLMREGELLGRIVPEPGTTLPIDLDDLDNLNF